VAAGLQTRLWWFSRRTPQGSSNRRRVFDEESAQAYRHAGFGRPCGARRSLV